MVKKPVIPSDMWGHPLSKRKRSDLSRELFGDTPSPPNQKSGDTIGITGIKHMLKHPTGWGLSTSSLYGLMLYMEEVERRKHGRK